MGADGTIAAFHGGFDFFFRSNLVIGNLELCKEQHVLKIIFCVILIYLGSFFSWQNIRHDDIAITMFDAHDYMFSNCHFFAKDFSEPCNWISN